MVKKEERFVKAKNEVLENLEMIKSSLDRCIEEGMIDSDSHFYNELVDLIEDTRILDTWEELDEIITLAKTLETDIDAWMSLQGKTTFSLIWPEKPLS